MSSSLFGEMDTGLSWVQAVMKKTSLPVKPQGAHAAMTSRPLNSPSLPERAEAADIAVAEAMKNFRVR